MTKKTNDLAKWIIVALALLTLVFNSGVLYNDVKHLKKEMREFKQESKEDMTEIKQDVKQINMYLIERSRNE